MPASVLQPRLGPEYSAQMVTALSACAVSIARLDARIINSPVAAAWRRRAAWSGYAKALQLQSVEIDEIDVFSWGCGLPIAGRPRRPSTVNIFEEFAGWQDALGDTDRFAWREARPLAWIEPDAAARHPPLVRAIEGLRRDCRADRSIVPWLGLPFALRDVGLCALAHPCLVGGAKGFRLRRAGDLPDWHAALRALEASARSGLDRLHALERDYRRAQRAIAEEYRPGALPRLLALLCFQPLVSPQSVARQLGMSVAGASKLLDRAVEAGLLVSITSRRSWRQFLAPDLAITFGLAEPRRGRPRAAPPPLPADRALSEVFDAFDHEMADIDAMLSGLSRRD